MKSSHRIEKNCHVKKFDNINLFSFLSIKSRRQLYIAELKSSLLAL